LSENLLGVDVSSLKKYADQISCTYIYLFINTMIYRTLSKITYTDNSNDGILNAEELGEGFEMFIKKWSRVCIYDLLVL
jgi:hypothetical protein